MYANFNMKKISVFLDISFHIIAEKSKTELHVINSFFHLKIYRFKIEP